LRLQLWFIQKLLSDLWWVYWKSSCPLKGNRWLSCIGSTSPQIILSLARLIFQSKDTFFHAIIRKCKVKLHLLRHPRLIMDLFRLTKINNPESNSNIIQWFILSRRKLFQSWQQQQQLLRGLEWRKCYSCTIWLLLQELEEFRLVLQFEWSCEVILKF